MVLQSVSVDGFKNVCRVKLQLHKMTALVSRNDYGKSNLLQGICYGVSFLHAGIEDKVQMMSNREMIPQNKAALGRDFHFEMIGTVSFHGQDYVVKYGYSFSWRLTESSTPRIVSEYLSLKQDRKGQKPKQIIARDLEKTLYQRSETGRCSTALTIEPEELAINRLLAYDCYYSEVIRAINAVNFSMGIPPAARKFYGPYSIADHTFDSAIQEKNLPKMIYQLQQKHPEKMALLENAFTSLFPEMEEITARRIPLNEVPGKEGVPSGAVSWCQDDLYLLHVKNRNLDHSIDFAMLSDGAKRIFLLLTRLLMAELSGVSLIAIEEPERSVHPGLLKSLLQITDQLLKHCRIIFTCYSPYVISLLEPSWIYIGVGRHVGTAEFHTFKTAGENALQNDAVRFHMSTGEYLFSMLSDRDANWDDYLADETKE